MNKDAFNFADTQEVATSAFKVIDAIQKLPKQYQVMGLACCFLLMCKVFKVSPSWALEHVDKVMKRNEDSRYWAREFTAIEEYVEKEIK